MRIILTFFIILSTVGSNITARTSEPDPVTKIAWQLDAEQEAFRFGDLNAYDSYFGQATGFGLSFVRYRPRGYDWRYRTQRMGSVAFTDWFRGAPAWSATSGLSYVGSRIYDKSIQSLSSIGAMEDRNIMAWQQSQGGRVSLSTANRTYNFRGTAGYNSGENPKNGWAYSLFASRTWGESYVIDGVWNDSWAGFGSVSKRIGDNHRIALTAWFTPTSRALQSASTAEAYELTDNNLYNPSWGWWGDSKRSINIRESQQPVVMLTHEYDSDDENLKIMTNLAGRFGTDSYSSVNWQNAPNPRPDYYRNMPSFQSEGSEMQERVTELWRTDPSVSQIDWQSMVDRNMYDSPRAHYIMESRVRDYREFTFQSTAAWSIDEKTTLMGGVEIMGAENLNYKRLDDLLGADYWLDVDVFAENDEDIENNTQSDMRHQDREVHEGDEFGYKYSIQAFYPRLWTRFEKQINEWDLNAAGSIGWAAYNRFGYYDKENFPGSESFGESEWFSRAEWTVEAGVGYNIGSRFRAEFSFMSQSLSPTPQSAFISPEYRNALVPNLQNEDVLSVELRLDYRKPNFRAYLGGFATSFRNRSEVRGFYDDLNHFFCNYMLSGINTRHMGIEFSAEVELASQVWLRAAGVVSDNRYTSNPQATELRESTGEEVGTEEVFYKGLHVATGPQTAGVVEIEYTPRSWIFSVGLNGFMGAYVTPTPLRRTERALGLEWIDSHIALDQEQFGAGMTMDVFVGKTIYFSNGQSMGVYAGVNNLLNRRNIRTSGYESSRIRNAGTYVERMYKPLDSKYYYAPGINFFITASWRF